MGSVSDHPLLATFAACTDPAVRDSLYLQVEVRQRECEALLLAMTAAVDGSAGYTDDGHRTAASWVVAVTNCSVAAARSRVRAARMTADLPEVADALFDGHIGASQVEAFTRLHAKPRVAARLGDSTALLVEHAAHLPHDDFVRVAERFQAWADPDGELADHATTRANRSMTLVRQGAGFRLQAIGDALTGTMFETALQPFIDAEFDHDWAQGRNLHGDRMCPALMARTNAQRRFDALAALVAAASDGTGLPTVNITIDEHTAANLLHDLDPCHADPEGTSTPDADEWLTRRCETTDGAPVSRRDALVALLVGNLRTVVHDSHGRIIHLGRTRRLFTGAARQAALLGNDHCIAPGCTIRNGRLQIDHTIAWAGRARGPTDPHNANTRCGHHNRTKDTLRQSVEPHPDIPAAWITRRLDGTIIGPRTSPARPDHGRDPAAVVP